MLASICTMTKRIVLFPKCLAFSKGKDLLKALVRGLPKGNAHVLVKSEMLLQ